jgi:hypothetical protein
MDNKTSGTAFRTEIKDVLRRVRARLRDTGGTLVEKAPMTPGGERFLRPFVGEIAQSMDRFLGRSEDHVLRALRPRTTLPEPAFQSQIIAACLQAKASEHVQRSFERQLRSWLALTLRRLGDSEPILLEKPLRLALQNTGTQPGQALETSTAALTMQLLAAPIWRRSGLRTKADAKHWPHAVITVAIALLSVGRRQSLAPVKAQPLLEAAHRLLEAEWKDVPSIDQSAFANWLSKRAELL